MAKKVIQVDPFGEISFYKRRGISSIKIRINGPDVSVSLPFWLSYKSAVSYVQQKSDWIQNNRAVTPMFRSGMRVGKNYTLFIKRTDSTKISGKVRSRTVAVTIPHEVDVNSKTAQDKLKKYAQKTLLVEAEELLIPRLNQLAAKTRLLPRSVQVKQLKSRWGSCSSNRDITLNSYLVQLPWRYIDYVIYHELCHLDHMNHSKDFWSQLIRLVPDAKQLRKEIKQYSPHVIVS